MTSTPAGLCDRSPECRFAPVAGMYCNGILLMKIGQYCYFALMCVTLSAGSYSAGVKPWGSHDPVVKSSVRASSLVMPHLWAVSR